MAWRVEGERRAPQADGVDESQVLRAVRRRNGWDQRELARRAGTSSSTVAAIESGQRPASLAVLRRVLQAGGLDLVLDLPPAPLPEEVVGWLHRSLPQRLSLSLGGRAVRFGRPDQPAVWQVLRRLAGRGAVLHGDAALAAWRPPEAPLDGIDVCLPELDPQAAEVVLAGAVAQAGDARLVLQSGDASLVVRHRDRSIAGRAGGGSTLHDGRHEVALVHGCRHPAALARIAFENGSCLAVEAPGDLALRPEHASERRLLQGVAAALHEAEPLDQGGRRRRAHADPRHGEERDRVFHTKRWRSLPMPDAEDVRGWRLGDDAALSAWLRRYRFPA
jgi:transcriptional regulator with XRE-family HTH domain